MLVPQYWAECRLVDKVAGRPRVLRLLGWSDTSQADAQRHADERAREAMRQLQAGKKVVGRDIKVPYGLPGLPIREPIVARIGDMVVTRNSYGARCLNVPDVLFVDVDLAPQLPGWLAAIRRNLFWCHPAAIVLGFLAMVRGPGLGCSTMLVGVLLTVGLTKAVDRFRNRRANWRATRSECRTRLDAVVRRLAGSRFALYETPMGFRLLALHTTFDPTSDSVRALFEAFGTDPLYARMSALQACFRARLTGKPWRMGVRPYFRIWPRVWPEVDNRKPRHEARVAHYEDVARRFAACRYLADLGDGPVDARCAEVQRLHDEQSRAHQDLPLA